MVCPDCYQGSIIRNLSDEYGDSYICANCSTEWESFYNLVNLRHLRSSESEEHDREMDIGVSLCADDYWFYKKHKYIGTPMHAALARGEEDAVIIALEQDPSLASVKDEGDLTLLHFAARFGTVRCAEQLFKTGADVNARSADGSTPLLDAFHIGYENLAEIVELLISHGADINSRNQTGCTPLHFAAWRRLTEIAEKNLLSRGAAVNVRDVYGFTPLHMAFRSNGLIPALLQAGADINAEDNMGNTPLFYFISEETLKLAIAHGADLSHTNHYGQRLLDYHRQMNNTRAVNILIEHDA